MEMYCGGSTSFSCNNMIIDVKNVNHLMITCSGVYGCSNTKLNGNYGKNISINALAQYASYNEYWNFMNAKSVTINGYGDGLSLFFSAFYSIFFK